VKLAIVGAGMAGVAAAHAAVAQGAQVSLFHGPAGASALFSGALDFDPEARSGETVALTPELAAFVGALGHFRVGSAPCVIATAQGNVRRARGRDAALLDLAALGGKRVALADLGRDDWDATLLAKSYAASTWAADTRTRFEAVPVAGLKSGSERRIAPFDLAALHDQPERVDFLATALASVRAQPDAWLLGPWLGIEREVAAELAQRLAVPVGEAASQPGGAAGARFELNRDRWFAKSQVLVRRERVARVEARGAGFVLQGEREPLGEFSAVVLAIGGVASGGVALGSHHGVNGAAFHLSLAAPVVIELDAQIADVSSLATIDFAARGVGVLERVGVRAEASGAAYGAPGLFVAGDTLSARPRSALSAASSGAVAAHSALAYLRAA
jgi:anaerobic glycerol-3-phosphate dehydrogenase